MKADVLNNSAIQEVDVFRRKQVLRALLTRDYFTDVTFDDDALGRIILNMTRDVYGYTCGQRVVAYPDGWREALKERFAPAWWKRRHPVRYKEFDALVVFPNFLRDHPVQPAMRTKRYTLCYIDHEKNPFPMGGRRT